MWNFRSCTIETKSPQIVRRHVSHSVEVNYLNDSIRAKKRIKNFLTVLTSWFLLVHFTLLALTLSLPLSHSLSSSLSLSLPLMLSTEGEVSKRISWKISFQTTNNWIRRLDWGDDREDGELQTGGSFRNVQKYSDCSSDIKKFNGFLEERDIFKWNKI